MQRKGGGMGEKGYNTNLATEFYVMSSLHRLGLNATLTLGNKKAAGILHLGYHQGGSRAESGSAC